MSRKTQDVPECVIVSSTTGKPIPNPGTVPPLRKKQRQPRNQICNCGSGRRFKECCLKPNPIGVVITK